MEFKSDFGLALAALKAGERVTRRRWNGSCWLVLQVPDANSKMTLPYLYMETVQGDRAPMALNSVDLLSNDWGILDGN